MEKDKELFISAVIVAAGRGTRMNMDINKQYIEVVGKPVLARTLQVFQDCDLIDEVVLVVNSHDIVYCKQSVVDAYGFTKVKALVAGGSERQYSVYNGLSEVSSGCDVVLIHDGARPFVKEKSLSDSINAAREYGASCVAVPVKDTIKTGDKEGFVGETLDRSILWAIQTPQTFRYDLVMEAHRKAMEDGFLGTDDAVLVERIGYRMKLVMGSYDNIKITTQEDLVIAEAIVG
ncbi:MAG: 2-C-methyl-D-erythritol 4-phosphate cytidylyltransferase [Clostridia bacterium]|nr:2-C-methyl-D-erythritol 4-phosphate cytidylyltransferase [Clostridia bacterium]